MRNFGQQRTSTAMVRSMPAPPAQVDQYGNPILVAGAVAGGAALLVGLLAVGPFVVWPFIIKGFKPEMPYWRRVGVGMGISAGLATARFIAAAALDKD